MVFSQNQIPVEDFALSYKYEPENLNFIQWVGKTNKFIYNNNWENLVLKDAENPDYQKIIDLKAFYPNLKYAPYLTFVGDDFLIFKFEDKFHFFNFEKNEKQGEFPIEKAAENFVYNPESQYFAYTLGNNLFIGNQQTPKIPITDFKDPNIVSGQSIHRQEFGIKSGIFFSPNAEFLAFYQKNENEVTSYPLVDISTTPATISNIKYPMAGQKSEKAKVGVFNLKTQKTIYLDIDTSDEHYLTNLSFSPNGDFILLAEISRSQDYYELNQYSTSTGKKVKTILSERNSKWVEPQNPAVFYSENDFLWLSQKDGFMNVYSYNLLQNKEKQLTKFKWVVNEILGFSADKKFVFISGTGTSPLESHTFKVDLKTSKVIKITSEEGTHHTQLSKNGKYLLDEFSSISTPRIIQIVENQNLKKTELLKSNFNLDNYHLATPEIVKIKADDKKTDLYARIIKPKNFNPDKKYPVLIYVYGGPHAQLVTNSWNTSADLWQMAMANQHDYIIFTLDNRGTKNRGFEFETVIHRNLATYALKDQLFGVAYLKSLPYVDTKRIAVNGWSFGGFVASSLLTRYPEVFNTGVAGGAVTDWKFYEIMYGERYMDTPQENPEGYKDTQISTHLHQLKGKLLFIHGYVDDVVVPQHAFEVMESSIQHSKNIDVFFYPKHKHNVYGQDRVHLIRKIKDYILENNQ